MREAQPARKSVLASVLSRREVSVAIILLLFTLVFYWINPLFLSGLNIQVILNIVSELGIPALGVTILMIAGEFDLSVGAVFAFTPAVATMLNLFGGVNVWIAAPAAIGVAALIGLVNGLITVKAKIPSFITTLGGLMIYRGASLLLLAGSTYPFNPDPNFTGLIGTPLGLGVWIFAQNFWFMGILLVLLAVLGRHRFGNWIYATGGKRESARAMGINTDRVKIVCFMICSVLVGFAGMMQSARLNSVNPYQGDGMEFEAIASAVIGGTSLFGGAGTLVGSVIGAFLTRMIDNGLVMARAPAYVFRIYLGSVIIIAVIFNLYIQRRARRMK